MHQGAFARHLTSRCIEIAVILEDLLMKGEKKVRHFMVKNPTCAQPWQALGVIRQVLLENGFSYLPVYIDAEKSWRLISDVDIARYFRAVNNTGGMAATTLQDAMDRGALTPKPVKVIEPDLDIAAVVQDELPVLVGEGGNIIGIVTAFDLL
jgi:CBS domain-containing protein